MKTGAPHTALLLMLLAWPALLPVAGSAQPASQMPLLLVDGSRYARRTFDVRGRLEKYQELEIGRLRREADALDVRVTIYAFDDSGQGTDTVRTTIRCSPQAADMVMNVLAVLEPDGRRVEVRLTGGEIAYPARVARLDTLQDVSLEARVEQGVLGFLGSKSRLRLQDRVARPLAESSQQDAYLVTEALHMRFYVLGIKVRERTYRIEETIDPARGLLKQGLRAADGSSVTLERLG